MTVLAVLVGAVAIFVPGLPFAELVVRAYEIAIAGPTGFENEPLNVNLVTPALRGLVAGVVGAAVTNLLFRNVDFSIVLVAVPIVYALLTLGAPELSPLQDRLTALGSAESFASASAQVVAGCIGFTAQCRKK